MIVELLDRFREQTAGMQQPEDVELIEALQRIVDEDMARSVAKGRAEFLLQVLDFRRIALTDEQRGKVLACRDEGQFTVWVPLVITAKSADELF